jgi:CRP-like cAMP-binding protein
MPEDQMQDYTNRFYYKGETIFNEGVGGDTAFLVKSGRVGISRQLGDEDVPLSEFGPGEIFGEMAILLSGPRTATAMMIEAGDLILLPKERFLEQLDQAPTMVRTMFYSLMHRLAATTERLRPGREHSLFLSVCRLLDRQLDRLQLQRGKALPYKEALRQVKDITLVSSHEIEEVFFKLQELGLVNCHKDGVPSRSFVFTQVDGFLAACERHFHQYSDHLADAGTHDEAIDLIDLQARTGYDPDRLLQLVAGAQMPQGVFKVSRKALKHWVANAPAIASDARVGGQDEELEAAAEPAEI